MLKMKWLSLVVIAFFAVNGYSQKKSDKSKTVVFSSIYLNTNGKSCKEIEEEIFGCKPVGGYRIFSAYHNVTENVWIETASGEEVAQIPSSETGAFTRHFGKVEWRLANGKPFAIITRFAIFSYDEVEANKDLTDDYSKFPQVLVVKGLTGNEQIDFELDVKTTPNVNRKARDLADANYGKNR
jgi:hypothetical protein